RQSPPSRCTSPRRDTPRYLTTARLILRRPYVGVPRRHRPSSRRDTLRYLTTARLILRRPYVGVPRCHAGTPRASRESATIVSPPIPGSLPMWRSMASADLRPSLPPNRWVITSVTSPSL